MVFNEYVALKLHKVRLDEYEHEREHLVLEKFARKAREQLKLFEPLRKSRH